MADEIDAAQRVNELHQCDALAGHHRRVGEIRSRHERTHCAECGEEIPVRRRAAVPGCQLCVGCQSEIERGVRE